MRRPAGWWTYGAAVLAAVAGGGTAWWLFAAGTAKPQAALLPLPGLWLAGAALVGRRAGRGPRAATAAAVGSVLAVNLLLAATVWTRDLGLRGLADRIDLEVWVLVGFPVAAVTAVANLAGWWLRRRVRLGADLD